MNEPTFEELMEQIQNDKHLLEPCRENMLHLWITIRALQRKVSDLETTNKRKSEFCEHCEHHVNLHNNDGTCGQRHWTGGRCGCISGTRS